MRSNHDIESQPLKGILICLVAYFFVALLGLLKKILPASVSLAQILFFQSATCLLLIIPDVFKRGLKPIKAAHLSTYSIRILSGLGCYLMLFYIIRYMPLAQAFLYQYSASLWIPFISLVWLGKSMQRNLWLGILLGFVGIILILRPQHSILNAVGLCGLSCGILQGVSVVAIRKLSFTESTQNILFYYFLAGTSITMIYASLFWHPLTIFSTAMLIAIGIATFIAQKLVTVSLRYASAGTLAPICYSSLLFSGLWGWLFWQELPDHYTVLGMLLVMAGCLSTAYASSLNFKSQTTLVAQ